MTTMLEEERKREEEEEGLSMMPQFPSSLAPCRVSLLLMGVCGEEKARMMGR